MHYNCNIKVSAISNMSAATNKSMVAIVALIGCILVLSSNCEARALVSGGGKQSTLIMDNSAMVPQQPSAPIAPIDAERQANMLASQLDSDDDDDDDDKSQNQFFAGAQEMPSSGESSQLEAAPSVVNTKSDLKTAASHHHHHHVKGWLDMGAWTGKKGAFGWHDKHPVGKGKK